MLALIVRWTILAIAVAASAALLPGVRVEDTNGVLTIVVMAGTLGALNALVRPVLVILSCGCVILSLGLFLFVINPAVFRMASWVSENWFESRFHVDSFWWALAGSIITGIVSFLLELLLSQSE